MIKGFELATKGPLRCVVYSFFYACRTCVDSKWQGVDKVWYSRSSMVAKAELCDVPTNEISLLFCCKGTLDVLLRFIHLKIEIEKFLFSFLSL